MIIKYKNNNIKEKIDKIIDESLINNKKIDSIELDKSEFVEFVNILLDINIETLPCDVDYSYRGINIFYKNMCLRCGVDRKIQFSYSNCIGCKFI